MVTDPDGETRPAIHVDPMEFTTAEGDPEAEVSLDLSAPFAEALRERARAEVVEAPIRSVLLRAQLSEETRKERRNLLAASAVGLAVGWVGLVPNEASVLGVTLGVEDTDRLLWLFIGSVVYFLVAFALYAFSDLSASRVQGYLALAERRRGGAEGVRRRSAQEEAEDVLLRLARVVVRRRGERRLQRRIDRWASVSVGSAAAVFVLDYVVPLGLAAWALVSLGRAL